MRTAGISAWRAGGRRSGGAPLPAAAEGGREGARAASAGGLRLFCVGAMVEYPCSGGRHGVAWEDCLLTYNSFFRLLVRGPSHSFSMRAKFRETRGAESGFKSLHVFLANVET